jgi:hypothetical protein
MFANLTKRKIRSSFMNGHNIPYAADRFAVLTKGPDRLRCEKVLPQQCQWFWKVFSNVEHLLEFTTLQLCRHGYGGDSIFC